MSHSLCNSFILSYFMNWLKHTSFSLLCVLQYYYIEVFNKSQSRQKEKCLHVFVVKYRQIWVVANWWSIKSQLDIYCIVLSDRDWTEWARQNQNWNYQICEHIVRQCVILWFVHDTRRKLGQAQVIWTRVHDKLRRIFTLLYLYLLS